MTTLIKSYQTCLLAVLPTAPTTEIVGTIFVFDSVALNFYVWDGSAWNLVGAGTPPVVDNFLLLEDDSFFLLEDSSKLILG